MDEPFARLRQVKSQVQTLWHSWRGQTFMEGLMMIMIWLHDDDDDFAFYFRILTQDDGELEFWVLNLIPDKDKGKKLGRV